MRSPILSRRSIFTLLAALLVALGGAAAWGSIRPSNDRTWIPDQAVLPSVDIDGRIVRVRNVRNFAHSEGGRFAQAYDDREYDLDRLETAWFVLVPFSERWRGPAHSFVSFGFADSQFVAISVEARKEPGEHYAVLTGLLKRFELMYVVGDERDLIGRRAIHEGDDVYLYPVRAPREKIRQLFLDMLQRADGLRRAPEFYNTVTNNCTSNIVRHVNAITPGRVPKGIRTVLPGYTDGVALGLGLIDSELSLEEARRRFRINDRARRHAEAPDFSLRIRAADGELRTAAGGTGARVVPDSVD